MSKEAIDSFRYIVFITYKSLVWLSAWGIACFSGVYLNAYLTKLYIETDDLSIIQKVSSVLNFFEPIYFSERMIREALFSLSLIISVLILAIVILVLSTSTIWLGGLIIKGTNKTCEG